MPASILRQDMIMNIDPPGRSCVVVVSSGVVATLPLLASMDSPRDNGYRVTPGLDPLSDIKVLGE